jgi:exodeoxyribonuclease V alpha subunit
MEEIKGYVEHIVYRNEDNGYTVFHLNNSDGEVTCVGSFHYIEEGELLRLKGGYTTHKMYGLQFAVEESEICEPEDLVSIFLRILGTFSKKCIASSTVMSRTS